MTSERQDRMPRAGRGEAVGPRPRPAASARRWIALLSGGAYFLAGCYTYVPVASTPGPGSQIAFDITDAGRVALAERLGPGVTRIEGQVTGATAEEYAVAVTAVSQIGGGRTRWSGESMRLRRDYVARSETRKLSRGRTALAVGAAVIGIVVSALVASLAVGGDKTPSGPGGEGPSGET